MNKSSAEKLAEVLASDEAKEILSKAGSIAEIATILNGYGVEIDASEIAEILKNTPVGELSEDDLEIVAGGGFLKKVWGHIWDALNGLLDGYLDG